jgi:hypothetical protein
MNISLCLRREIARGGKIPRGWRLAWHEPRRGVGIYFPLPIQYFLRAAREILYRLRLALSAPTIENAQTLLDHHTHRERQRFADEYARGFLSGWHECFDTCMQAVEEEVSNAGELWNVGDMVVKTSEPSREN